MPSEWGELKYYGAKSLCPPGVSVKGPNIEEQDEWSNDACRGYVIMAMEDCGFSKKEIRRVVGQLYEVFDLNSVEDAKEKFYSSPY